MSVLAIETCNERGGVGPAARPQLGLAGSRRNLAVAFPKEVVYNFWRLGFHPRSLLEGSKSLSVGSVLFAGRQRVGARWSASRARKMERMHRHGSMSANHIRAGENGGLPRSR